MDIDSGSRQFQGRYCKVDIAECLMRLAGLKSSFLVLATICLMASPAFAHAVAEGDKGFIQEITGVHFVSFIYLGAKHMITGYDHLLFLAGVIFFLYKMKDIGIYVTLFAVGHSLTMLAGVYFNIVFSSYIVDAIIGFSVAYKALDNLGAWKQWFGFQPDTKAATLIFGLLHGFGLATKVQEYGVAPDGLLTNLIAFNIGVELGQLMALTLILIVMSAWRASPSFSRQAFTANMAMVVAGFMLMAFHITGYLTA